ncbi:hypothetical protein GCM10023066_56120 [Nocardioides kongjuensis]
MRGWLTDDQGTRLVQHRIALATRAWDAHAHDPGSLLRGTVLSRGARPASERRQELTAAERTFLDASAADADAVARRERRRPDPAAGARRVRRSARLLTGVSAAYLFDARSTANDARAAAESAQRNALSRKVAAEARLTRDTDPSIAAQLAAAAYRISPTPEARSALLDGDRRTMVTRLTGPEGPSRAIVSPDGRTLAIALADGTVRFHDIGADGRPSRTLAQQVQVDDGLLYASAYSEDGRLLAVGSASGKVALYDVSSSRAVAVATASVEDSAILALLVHDGVVYAGTGAGLLRWRIGDGELVALPATPAHDATVASLALAPDGRLVTGSNDGRPACGRSGRSGCTRSARSPSAAPPPRSPPLPSPPTAGCSPPAPRTRRSGSGTWPATGPSAAGARGRGIVGQRRRLDTRREPAGRRASGPTCGVDCRHLAPGRRHRAHREHRIDHLQPRRRDAGDQLHRRIHRFWPRHPAAPTTAFGDTVWNLGTPDTGVLYASTGSA